jgi:uncharacterized protein (TIGR02246 family)
MTENFRSAIFERQFPMRTVVMLVVAVAILGVVCLGAAQEKTAPKPGAKPAAKTPASKTPAAKPAPAVKDVSDEEAIRQAAATYVKAYSQGDAKAVAALFTADAEYVDEEGRVFQGRESIEKALGKSFAETPGCKLDVKIESIRFIGPGAAVEDGAATVIPPGGGAPAHSRYTAVHLKSDGKWLLASVRDRSPGGRAHRDQIKALEWLVGDWVDEGPDSVMLFSCRPSENGTYLLREFAVKIAGYDAMNGSQRFGWDPQTKHLRAWTFDSEGGFADGVWHRDGESWILKSSGVNADGEATSATTVFTSIDAHTMTWQALDVTIGSARLPDTGLVRIVRKPPAAKQAAR